MQIYRYQKGFQKHIQVYVSFTLLDQVLLYLQVLNFPGPLFLTDALKDAGCLPRGSPLGSDMETERASISALYVVTIHV